MFYSKLISIEVNFGSLIMYLSGILTGVIIASLLYVLSLILSINKKKKIIEASKDAIKEEDVRRMIDEARKSYQLLVKSDDKEVKEKHLTNTRAAGKDHTSVLKRPRMFSLETALDYLNQDELLEVTPKHFRMRKKILDYVERKKSEYKNKQ